MNKSKKRILAGIMSLLLIITTVFTGNVVTRAEGDVAGQIAVTITGNGTLDYTFYDSEDIQCEAGGAGQIRYDDSNRMIEIPANATKVQLTAAAAPGWQADSASGTKNGETLSEVDNGIFGEAGVTIDGFTYADNFSVNLSFSEQQQQSGLNIPVGSVGFEINNSQNGKVYYSFTGNDGSWTEIGNNGIIESSTIGTNTTIHVKAVPNETQSVDVTDGANYVDIGGERRDFSAAELTGGVALFGYSSDKAHKVHIEFAGSASTAEAGDIAITVNRAQGTSAAYYRIGDSGNFTKIDGSSVTLSASSELQNVASGTKIYFKADIDGSQVLDEHNQNWYRVGDQETQFDLDELASGSAYIEYDPNNAYNVQIAFDGGNGGGEQQDVSFSCSSMNGNENERVNAVEVWLNESDGWVDYYNTNALDQLAEGTTFKIRIKMNDGFTIDKVFLRYEPFGGGSVVEYFKEDSQTDYDEIIASLMSEEGYAITFQPEADSKDADNNSTLQAETTCLQLQYQTAISYDENVNINMFFQTKDGESGYGVWRRNSDGQDIFVDGVGDSDIIFSFNGNTYGDQGDPFALGYGKDNTGDSPIQVSYISGYTGVTGTVTDTPETYDYFSAGGYATGENQNTIRIDDYDGLIDEVYIDSNNDNIFAASERLTAKTGSDAFVGEYSYYEETLDVAASYNILIRKHLSTRVSLKWSYTDVGTDFYVDHGKIFIEKVVRGDETLLQAETDSNGDLVLTDGVPNTIINELGNDYGVTANAGEAFLECGDVVTIRLIPTYGYQIKEAKLNGCVPLTPNEKVSSFTFTVEGNLHLAGNFIESSDVTDTSGATTVRDASITDGQNATDSGNLKLTVSDYDGTYEKETAALELAKGDNAEAETIATLDMTLDSMVSKGNDEYWTENISEFDDPIDVNLELNDDSYVGGDTYVVVREHDGELKIIEDATYEDGTLTIPTEKFSTYSIVKIPVADEDRPNMYLGYDPRGVGEEAGSVTVKCNDVELPGTDGYYKYDSPTQAITFELKKPSDRTDCTPVVEVVFPQENDAAVVKEITVTGNQFTVTPSTDSGLSGSPFMEVYVYWSAYDKVGPDEDQFMVILRKYSDNDSFVFQNNPTIEETASLDGESKYIFPNGTNVSVEIQPGENRELVEVYVDTNGELIHYSAEPQEGDRNIAELKTSDGKFVVPNLAPWTFVEAICIDLPVLSDIHLTNESQTLYDTMKRSEVGITATCKMGDWEVPGTVELEGGNELLTVGENEYKVVFTSNLDDGGEPFTAEGTITLKVLHKVDISGLGWTGTTFTYNVTSQGPTFKNDLPKEIQVASIAGNSEVNKGDYTAIANITLAEGLSSEYYKLVNPSGTIGITITEGGARATVTQAWSITAKDLASAEVTLGDALTYNGENQTQTVSSVKIGDTTLTASTDYTVSGNEKKDAGTYTLTITGTGNYTGTATKEFTISKATPTITLSNLSETTQAPTGVKATISPEDATATIVIEYQVELSTNGQTTKQWVKTRPTIEGTYPVRAYLPEGTANLEAVTDANAVTGTYSIIPITAEHNDVTSISVTTQPTKTSYVYGESFDKTGMVVTATFADGSTKEVTDDVTFEGDIVPSNTTIKAVYTKDGVTVKTDIKISVSRATIDISALKWTGTTFEYNGTAQGPAFSSTLPTGVVLESKTGASNTSVGNYSAVANLKLADGYSKEYYKLVNALGTAGIVVAADGATATVTQAWSITKATSTINKTDPASNALKANLAEDAKLADKVLTPAEQALGGTVSLTVQDITNTVSSADKTLVEGKLGGATLGMYLDVDLTKVVSGLAKPVTETISPVTIRLTLPTSLINTDTTKVRTYKMIRVHDFGAGPVAETLPCTFDAAAGTISFETKYFSTYALGYSDVAVPASPSGNPSEDTTTNTAVNVVAPKTGDAGSTVLWYVIAVLIGLGAVYFGKKKINK